MSDTIKESPVHPVTVEDLRNLEFWDRLGSDHLARLAEIAVRVELPGDFELFREGDPADTVYIVIWGRVSLSIHVPGREDAIVGTISPGELLGWSALMTKRKWLATARTRKPTSLLAMPGEDLASVCEFDHEIGYYVMRSAFAAVAGRLQDTRLQLLDMFAKP
ncbi:Crp/Fnr family transcriptional regulator [Haliangium sp.]|uniref:Crp/Fnr family transcriptional regulator n=1 Tax=Haliangium sp. TaxID=2663208 RepID=UPI003D100F77